MNSKIPNLGLYLLIIFSLYLVNTLIISYKNINDKQSELLELKIEEQKLENKIKKMYLDRLNKNITEIDRKV